VEGKVFNIGGGSRRPLREVVALLEELTGKQAKPVYQEPEKGDVFHTWADVSQAEGLLAYRPTVSLEEGLPRGVEWVKALYGK